jgi:branched-chain amino acid transport system substrate-binding protein
MRIELGCRAIRSAVTAAVTAVALSGVVAACGGGDTTSSSSGASSSTAASGGRQTPAAAASTCGLGNGTTAMGAPIRLGGIATKQPGIDFTDIPNTAKAYFACVNDNGGINGRRIDYTIETEQTDPGQVASLARKLVQREKVLGIVGNTSLIECAVNHRYYEQQGYYIIGSGIAPECYSTPNSAAVNMGPRYSVDGATQYLIRQKVKKLVLDQSNVPDAGYVAGGFLLIANDANIPSETLKDDVPIQDADAIAIKLVQAAGAGGGVVLNFTPPEVLKILQAAQRLGLQDRVRWACSTPCNTDFLADALGPQWDGKLGVNAELNLTTANGPDSRLYRDVLRTYAPRIPLGSFSQMGFVEARIATHALMSVRGELTVRAVNAAFRRSRTSRPTSCASPGTPATRRCTSRTTLTGPRLPRAAGWSRRRAASRSPSSTRRSLRVRKSEAGGGGTS